MSGAFPYRVLGDSKTGTSLDKIHNLIPSWVWSFDYSLAVEEIRENYLRRREDMYRIENQHFRAVTLHKRQRPIRVMMGPEGFLKDRAVKCREDFGKGPGDECSGDADPVRHIAIVNETSFAFGDDVEVRFLHQTIEGMSFGQHFPILRQIRAHGHVGHITHDETVDMNPKPKWCV